MDNKKNSSEQAEKVSHKQGFEYGENAPVDKSRLVSITDAAEANNVTRQAIYVAIKLNKLKAYKDAARWMINLDDLKAYRSQRYCRTKSMYNGELIYDAEKGYFSVNQVARNLAVPAQKIYYAMRIGLIKASRKGSAWVISQQDVEAYRSGYLTKKKVAAAN